MLLPNFTIRKYTESLREYCLEMKISDSTLGVIFGGILHDTLYDDKVKEAGPVATDLAAEVLKIDGVECIIIKKYSFDVIKASAFDWEKIEPRIIEIINNVYIRKTIDNIQGSLICNINPDP